MCRRLLHWVVYHQSYVVFFSVHHHSDNTPVLVLGIIFTLFCSVLCLSAPIAVFIYNRRDKLFCSYGAADRPSSSADQEARDIKEEGQQHHAPFFELNLFESAPFGIVGGSGTGDRSPDGHYTLAIETASKSTYEWYTVDPDPILICSV